ncbi:hypothetical protein P8452_36133 [Trifolium repens]|nr:hypothetical protein P8452_36133 [Trifolium repens]
MRTAISIKNNSRLSGGVSLDPSILNPHKYRVEKSRDEGGNHIVNFHSKMIIQNNIGAARRVVIKPKPPDTNDKCIGICQ